MSFSYCGDCHSPTRTLAPRTQAPCYYTQVHGATESHETDTNPDRLLVSSTLSNSTPNMHDQAKADSTSDLSLSLPSQLEGAELELHQIREQLRNMQAELQQALSASAAQQQILIPTSSTNKNGGAIKKKGRLQCRSNTTVYHRCRFFSTRQLQQYDIP
uniref:Uncharacterized protein n=1 Tax=Trichogramma kaykai TaxID=54128 RepID=A0ABD2WZ96_9HYME